MTPELLAAYRATDYAVRERGREIVVRPDRLHPELDRLLEGRGAAEAVFLTACNPGSRRLSEAENKTALARLKDILAEEDLEFLPAEHRAAKGPALGTDWPVEPSFLVLDLPPADALALAEMFGQNAVLWAAFDQPAQLLLTRLAVA